MIDVQPPLMVTRQRAGVPSGSHIPLDFTFAGNDVPVVRKSVAVLLDDICGPDVQGLPVMVEGTRADYKIVNVVSLLPCIDKVRSDIESWWTEADRASGQTWPSEVNQKAHN